MEYRELGRTGIKVSTLGFGAGHIGAESLDESKIEKLIAFLIENGINLFDTARGYGVSEERLGRFLKGKRDKVVICTKVGYGVNHVDDWSYDAVMQGIEEALVKLKTDYIDIVMLHTCSIDTLRRYEVVRALHDAKEQGKIRAAGYSGDNDELELAVNSQWFDCVECSINVCDQYAINNTMNDIHNNGLGLIVKRPSANAPWRFPEQPYGHYCEEYWKRFREMNIASFSGNWQETALRFSAFTYGVTSIIAGTTSIDHAAENIKYVEKGPLDKVLYDRIRESYNHYKWISEI